MERIKLREYLISINVPLHSVRYVEHRRVYLMRGGYIAPPDNVDMAYVDPVWDFRAKTATGGLGATLGLNVDADSPSPMTATGAKIADANAFQSMSDMGKSEPVPYGYSLDTLWAAIHGLTDRIQKLEPRVGKIETRPVPPSGEDVLISTFTDRVKQLESASQIQTGSRDAIFERLRQIEKRLPTGDFETAMKEIVDEAIGRAEYVIDGKLHGLKRRIDAHVSSCPSPAVIDSRLIVNSDVTVERIEKIEASNDRLRGDVNGLTRSLRKDLDALKAQVGPQPDDQKHWSLESRYEALRGAHNTVSNLSADKRQAMGERIAALEEIVSTASKNSASTVNLGEIRLRHMVTRIEKLETQMITPTPDQIVNICDHLVRRHREDQDKTIAQLADAIASLKEWESQSRRSLGSLDEKYENHIKGINGRLANIEGPLLRESLRDGGNAGQRLLKAEKYIDDLIIGQKRHADRFDRQVERLNVVRERLGGALDAIHYLKAEKPTDVALREIQDALTVHSGRIDGIRSSVCSADTLVRDLHDRMGAFNNRLVLVENQLRQDRWKG